MIGKIFAIRDGEGLTELTQTPYENEDSFQALIEKHPEILAGEQINPENPRQWVLISREMGVLLDNGIGRLDHLYIDQDAIPTFLEVKRGTDTRIRREIVGQMLDYAANGTQFWSIKDIRDAYERNTLVEETTTLSDIGIEDEDTFWKNVDMNLRNGRVRLLFVADVIPTTLQAIIEFLNKQMRDTEVYGLEIKQFVGKDGSKTLVPTLIGRTASAVQTKRGDTKAKYANREEFLSTVTDPVINGLFRNLFALADENNYKIVMGTSGISISVVDSSNKTNALLFGYGADASSKRDSLVTTFGWLKNIDNGILEHYKNEIGKLNFVEKTQSSNYVWQLSDKSTNEEMRSFFAVIQDVAKKIIG